MKGLKSSAVILAALAVSAATVFSFGCDGKIDSNGSSSGGPNEEIKNEYLLDNPTGNYEDFTIVEEVTEIYDTSMSSGGVGYTYNAAALPYLGVGALTTCNTVFDGDFLKSALENASRINVYASKVSQDSDIKNVDALADRAGRMYYNDGFMNASGVTGEEIVDYLLERGGIIDFKRYPSNYFYYLESDYVQYSLTLQAYLSNVQLYIDNLSVEYLNALDSVFNGDRKYSNLFNEYGTHVIMSGKYGGRVTLCYGAASDKYDLSGACSGMITSFIEKCLSGNSDEAGLPLAGKALSNYIAYNERLYISVSGGTVPSVINFWNFSKALQAYHSTVAQEPVLIGARSDGLVPLYKLLPEKYADRRAEFEQALNDYIASRKK